MNKLKKISIWIIILLVWLILSLPFYVDKWLSATSEVSILVEYKDSILKGEEALVNSLIDVISQTSNSQEKLLANQWDVILIWNSVRKT